MGKKSKTKIPDRWTAYKAGGDVIPGTQFIAFKVPLKSGYFRGVERSVASCTEKFTIEDLLQKVKGKLRVVIDLSYKGVGLYYDPEELESNGVKYEKLFTAGHVVPSDEIVRRFTSIVKDNLTSKPNDKLIGVHCTHGVNRTGYLITRYMVENLNFTAEDAQRAFEKGRGYPMERQNYIESLNQIEKSVKSKRSELLPAKEFEETDEESIQHVASNSHQNHHNSYFNSDSYKKPYYNEYNYEEPYYRHDYNHFSGRRRVMWNDHQNFNYTDNHWQNFPSGQSYYPDTGYEGYAHFDYSKRRSRYRPYERHGSNSGMYNWTSRGRNSYSKTSRTYNKSATQRRDRNVPIRNSKGIHKYFE